ncbi:MAG: V-type ATP synthase subunit I [Phycisphaerae bacterium]|jgi:V/A-type H+-transporting ATPase subunit I
MAIAQMRKILIASHKSEAAALLDELQEKGILHLISGPGNALAADEELARKAQRPRELEERISELEKDIAFLEQFKKAPTSLLCPKVPVSRSRYRDTTAAESLSVQAKEVNSIRKQLETLNTIDAELKLKNEDLNGWHDIDVPLEELDNFKNVKVFVGILTPRNFATVKEQLETVDAVLEVINIDKRCVRFVVAAMKEAAGEVHKILRAGEYEAFVHVDYHGTIAENIEKIEKRRNTLGDKIRELKHRAEDLAENGIDFRILCDDLRNKADAIFTESGACASDSVNFYEGWIKDADMHVLDSLMESYSHSCYKELENEADENVPVALENGPLSRPFESILSLFGPPKYTELDPTVFMAPFFAIFFGLCLTDAGYGIIMILASIFFLRRIQGDKRFFNMFLICSIVTVFAGAMTGGWFGSLVYDFAVKENVGWLMAMIEKTMWFDPLKDPIKLMLLSLACGYVQIMFGLAVGFIFNLKRRNFAAAFINKLCWILLLNALIAKPILASRMSESVSLSLSMLTFALLIVIGLFSVREGSWGVRIAGGLFELFGIIFYLGDFLSYLRIMALCLATAGIAMAVNIMAAMTSETPLVGWIIALIILVVGHVFNILLSALGAFVHTLRLQFVEFFPKFIEGGGVEFMPFARNYKYVHIEEYKN